MGAVVLALGVGQAVGESRQTGPLVMVEHHVTDPGLDDMVASTILVPEGWKVEGGITRPAPAFYSNPILADVTVKAPDGRAAHFFPSLSFEWNPNQQAQPFAPTMDGNFWHPVPESVGQWLLGLSQANPDPEVSELRLVAEEDVPELTRMLRERAAPYFRQVQQMNQTGAGVGVHQTFDTQATKVVFRYKEAGKALEETFLVTWQLGVTRVQGRVSTARWQIVMMRSMRGPVGTDYLNDPALAAIFASVHTNPKWDAAMRDYWTKLAEIRHRGQVRRRRDAAAAHQKRMQTLNETTEIIARGWKSRSEASDRMQEKTVDAIHERTPYTTPAGKTVKLPSFYRNVYTDGNGRYLLHNDDLHHPNRDPAFNDHDWQRIEPTDP